MGGNEVTKQAHYHKWSYYVASMQDLGGFFDMKDIVRHFELL